MQQVKLRVALYIESKSIPAWIYNMIEIINNGKYAEIVLVIEQNSNKKNINQNGSFYRFYEKLENKLFKLSPNAFENKNVDSILTCDYIIVNTESQNNIDYLNKDSLLNILDYKLDIIINLNNNKLSADSIKIAKYGVWYLTGGDNRNMQSQLFGVWEKINNYNSNGITIKVNRIDNSNCNRDLVITTANYATHQLNFNRNRSSLFFKAKALIPRQLELLYNLGAQQYFKEIDKLNNVPHFYHKPFYSSPTNVQTLKAILNNYTRMTRNKINSYFYFKQYILLYKFNNSDNFSTSFYNFKRITPPKDRFWADPFIIEKNMKYYVFLEELVYSEKKGKISVMELNRDGSYSDPKVVLEKPYHLSYPLLFEEENKLYMLPETSDNKTIELYECTNFPYEWKLTKILMDGVNAVDATLFKHNNLYWLFTNIGEEMGASTHDELYLFYTDDLINGTWKPHLRNPIVTDVRYSRPAGNIIVRNDRIFRPAQNCSKHYGYGMKIREILTLNETEYKERNVQSIYPDWEKDLISTHTLNHLNDLTIIDAAIIRKK